MQSKLLIIIATISVILGGAIAFGFGSAEAQPTGAKQIKLVITGEGIIPEGGGPVARFEDPEYGVVCYFLSMGVSCVKK